MKRVYLQKYKGEFVAPSVFTAMEGFRFYGYECVGFEEGELPELPLSETTPVIGWVRTVQAALRQLGVPVPPPIDYPEALRPWFGREIERTTLGAVRAPTAHGGTPGFFVKPVEHKLFTGFEVTDPDDWEEVRDFPDDTPVWRSSLVHFVSEWRCFVKDQRLVGIRHYYGDSWTLPHKPDVLKMIRAWDDAPAGCSIDVGVLADGGTALVEVNDGFALGDYGVAAFDYTNLLLARWKQMVKAKA
jgi:hypothetical protein